MIALILAALRRRSAPTRPRVRRPAPQAVTRGLGFRGEHGVRAMMSHEPKGF
ncbi:MAG: hypothetical protein AAFP13_16350 [Pseudomonadota bacterium]